jgi:Mg2+ and Co2+ transporter CorA
LLTHEDAITNIGIASSSRQLAEATKQDSSTMKTIAVMTMAFLPATFFAALFAVPSLQWDKPRVIGSNFWIYLAFALPSTALVFLVWLLVMNWKLIAKRFI